MAEITTHTETNFDPEVYIDTIYSKFTGDKPDDQFIKFILDSLHEVFKDGKYGDLDGTCMSTKQLVFSPSLIR